MSFLDKVQHSGTGYIRGRAVGVSRDLRRVLALPRKRPGATLDVESLRANVAAPCSCLTKFNKACCKELLPVQAEVLREARDVGGVLGPIGVGHGKSLCDLLTPMVVPGCKVAVLLIPSNLKQQMLESDLAFYGQHWKLPNVAGGRWLVPGRPTLHIVAYSELSGSKATDLLYRIQPDVVIADEAHSVRNRTAARTKRFLRFFSDFPKARLFAWSGTLTSRSLRDYAHLSNIALKEGSPTPLHWPVVEEWAGHLDPGDFRTAPGALQQFGGSGDGGDARKSYAKWLVNTPGVVSSGDVTSCQASLVFSERKLVPPAKILQHIESVKASWQRPDGEELTDPMSVGRCVRELSCGFFYRWRWPRKEPQEVVDKWLKARKEWHKELREKLKHATPHMDSPLLCAKAAIRWRQGYVHIERDSDGAEVSRREIPPGTRSGPLPVWDSQCWAEWERVRDTAKPETEAVWLDRFAVLDSAAWLQEGPGLCWYEFDAFGRELVREARAVHAMPGKDGDKVVASLKGTESVVASIRSHGTGKNLQMFSRNLVPNPPSSGSEWEQLVGRTSRHGQQADEVTVEVYRHTAPMAEAVEKARALAKYIQDSFEGKQRLVSVARYLW